MKHNQCYMVSNRVSLKWFSPFASLQYCHFSEVHHKDHSEPHLAVFYTSFFLKLNNGQHQIFWLRWRLKQANAERNWRSGWLNLGSGGWRRWRRTKYLTRLRKWLRKEAVVRVKMERALRSMWPSTEDFARYVQLIEKSVKESLKKCRPYKRKGPGSRPVQIRCQEVKKYGRVRELREDENSSE
ncbi:unnamed protein product [Cuscuta epithymum]|uniref:Uncharacterized protein n=1 Tax=Cuscuta epithymum TaxID=186058 RepID=A0AAV0CR47_9ASTE|nr:unnamed protein product [Cuscuta epithymum]